MKKIITIVFIISQATHLIADEVQFSASSPKVVALGEQFRVTFSLNVKPESFWPTDFKDFQILAGPSTSSNTSIQYINGQVTKKSTYTYTYILQAIKEGVFALPPAKILVKGETYYSNEIKIEVIKENAKIPSPNNQKNNETVKEKVSGKDLFIRVLVNKKNVFQGEHLVATVKLFTKLNLTNIDNAKFPSFNGFLKQDIETPPVSLQQENINGQIYGTGVLQRVLLFPQKTGEIIIDPFELDCIYQKRTNKKSRSIFDDFFNSYQNVRQTIKSKPVKIVVKPLPEGKPADFKGAVGNFIISSIINKTEVKTNEALTLKIKVSGNGNLKLIDPFKIKFPSDFETYDPKSSLKVKNTTNGATGSKTFEYLVIPRYAGDFNIPPVAFKYFDPKAKQYRTLLSNEFKIKVNKGESDETTTIVTGFSKEDVKFIGQDIRFIKQGLTQLKRKGEFLIVSFNFYLIYLAAFAIFIAIFFLRKKKIKESADLMLVKNKKANKYAKKRLKQAAKFLKTNNKELFYDEVLKAIWGYLSDKLRIPVAELSKDSAVQALQKQKIDQAIINKFIEVIDNCEFARYAPAAEAGQMDITYNETIKAISKFEQKIK